MLKAKKLLFNLPIMRNYLYDFYNNGHFQSKDSVEIRNLLYFCENPS